MSDPASQRRVQVMVEVAEGRVASAILGNGFLGHCVDLGADVTLLTPGVAYPPFVERYSTPGVTLKKIPFDTTVKGSGRWVAWERRIGARLVKHRMFRARRLLWRQVGARMAARDAGPTIRLLNENPPDVFVSTDVNMGFGRGLAAVCQRRGIPTLGNMFSWDHPYFLHPSRPDRVTCWSPVVKAALVSRSGFAPDQIEVTGAPAFDAYVKPENNWSRERLCNHLGLDPDRPILVYATLGQFKKTIDETGAFQLLLDELDAGNIPGNPQVVLRLHPVSREQYWESYIKRDDVVLSRYLGYCPGMRWWPTPEEVGLAANLLRHAAVCLSPGSSMAIEPAIFDTPTIVPIFNQYMPEEYERYFDSFWMSCHFRFLAERKLMAFVRSAGEMTDAICRALADRSWMHDERKTVREELLGPLDGRSTERLARTAVCLAGGPAPDDPAEGE